MFNIGVISGKGRGFSFQEFIFSHLFMVLCWNLMGRSASVAALNIGHCGWKDDCLTIEYARSKSDRKGHAKGNTKHIYANPEMPEICPILSLAIYCLCFRKNVSGKLFSGGFAEDRFTKALRKLLLLILGIASLLGVDVEDIGSHSNRKGAISYSLMFVEISAVQVYLRAGWSLGNVHDRYIFAGAGGDQIVGRTVCGLPTTSVAFSTLPPHFSFDDLKKIGKFGLGNDL